jgi:hypothetical protein
VTAAERDERHVWHKMLNELTNDAFSPAF